MAKKYVIMVPFVGPLTIGSVVSRDDLPAEPDALIAEGSIREAGAEEAKVSWIDPAELPKHTLGAKPVKAAEAAKVESAPSAAPAAPKKEEAPK